MKKIVSILAIVLFVTSCSSGKIVDVKSPCVSSDDGPCGPKKPINDWWLKNSSAKHNLKQNS